MALPRILQQLINFFLGCMYLVQQVQNTQQPHPPHVPHDTPPPICSILPEPVCEIGKVLDNVLHANFSASLPTIPEEPPDKREL